MVKKMIAMRIVNNAKHVPIVGAIYTTIFVMIWMAKMEKVVVMTKEVKKEVMKKEVKKVVKKEEVKKVVRKRHLLQTLDYTFINETNIAIL